MASKSKAVVFDKNPGRNAQTYGIAPKVTASATWVCSAK